MHRALRLSSQLFASRAAAPMASPLRASLARGLSTQSSYEFITSERRDGKVGLITLNRPKALNALCDQLIAELNAEVVAMDGDSEVGCIVITGSEKAFAAGADIKEMAPHTYMQAYKKDMLSTWQNVSKASTPIIAAVNGYALGGGCELAMMCDIIVAGERAKFGQPEVQLGTIPGCGGTQRLTRFVGKSKAMEMVLTGNMIGADEAKACGLVSQVYPAADLVDEAVRMGAKIASYSQPIISMAKQAVNASYETTLAEGMLWERRLFHSTFATHDQKEGMSAFAEKRKAEFKDE
jgi:enoyl-CoA hydratase